MNQEGNTSYISEILLIIISAIGLFFSWLYSSPIDEKPISISGFLSHLSPIFWVFFLFCLGTVLYVAYKGRSKLTAVPIFLTVLYMQMPRFLFTHPYQYEEFHQAKIFRMIETGSISGPFWWSGGDVGNAIMGTGFQQITNLPSQTVILYISPVLLLGISAIVLYSLFKREIGEVLSASLSLLFLGFSFNLLFANHYAQVFPYLAVFFPILLKYVCSDRGNSGYFLSLMTVGGALAITHLGAAFSLALGLICVVLSERVVSFLSGKSHVMKWSAGLVSLSITLILWDIFNPAIVGHAVDRIETTFSSFENLITLSFATNPAERFAGIGATIRPLYSFLVNLKTTLAFLFAVTFPLLVFFLCARKYYKSFSLKDRLRIFFKESLEKRNSFLPIILPFWLLHLVLIFIGYTVGGWPSLRFYQFSVIVIISLVATNLIILKEKRPEYLKDLTKYFVIGAILFAVIGFHVKWDTSFTYTQIPNGTMEMNHFAFQHSGAQFKYASTGSPVHLFQVWYRPEPGFRHSSVSPYKERNKGYFSGRYFLIDPYPYVSMSSKYSFDTPPLQAVEEIFIEMKKKSNVIYMNSQSERVRAILTRPS